MRNCSTTAAASSVGAWIGVGGEFLDAHRRWPGDVPEIFGVQRIRADHLQIVASAARLADDQPRLCGVAAEIKSIDPLGLQLVDELRLIRLAG